MEVRIAAGFALSLILLAGCHKKGAVTSTETRQIATCDSNQKLFATSDERFRNARPRPVQGDTPKGWMVLPATQSRLLNYRFGPSGTGEVWVSSAAETVADNVNRWLRRFGAQPLDAAGIANLRKIPLLGTTGVWVQAQGDCAGDVDTPPKPGQGMAGVVAVFQGQTLTVTMLGPAAEVRFGIPALEDFVKTLRPVDTAE
jgi:hypothetical protein